MRNLLTNLIRHISSKYGRTGGILINEAVREVNQKIEFEDFEEFLALIDERKTSIHKKLRNKIGDIESKILLLKITNLLVAKYEYIYRHSHLLSYPIGVNLDPANGCTLHCPGCVHSKNPKASNFLWPSGNLTEQNYKKFIEEYGPYVIQINFYNYGEPLLNNLTPQFIKIARRYLITSVSSTNLCVKNLDVEQLVLSGLNLLVLSIDGATPTTYSMFRKGGDFALVMDNIKQLVEAKKRLNTGTPFLSWQFLVFKHNVHEIEHVKQLAQNIGVNQLIIAKPFSVSWDDPSIVVENSFKEETIIYNYNFSHDQDNHNHMLACLDARVINEHFSRSWRERYKQIEKNFPKIFDIPPPTCEWLYKNITMDALGRIMPCCKAPARNENLVYSSIDVHETFNSELYILSRMYFADKTEYERNIKGLDKKGSPFCSKCPHPNFKLNITAQDQVRDYLYKAHIYRVLSEESKDTLTNW